ncbi:AI-2E family transporter [Brevibacillus daliensis]|uniref:AI-2E family transporter n=1 Tax=Brevibacillus daliensis TaxID=2892995 RepID=UPI001E2C4E87|nr:AI-2E family transporter [Brevibacillus daliensis]
MPPLKETLQSSGVKKIVVLLTIVAFAYFFRSMMNMILFFYIITFLMNELHVLLVRTGRIHSKIMQKIILLLQYAIFISLIVIGVYKFLPSVIEEVTPLVQQIINFYKQPIVLPNNVYTEYIVDYISKIDIASYLNKGMESLGALLGSASKFGLNFFLGTILSLFFLLEKEKIKVFSSKFKTSKLSYFYNDLAYFGQKFTNSFGKVIEVQFIIALCNSLLSIIFLSIMDFPHLIALGIMIFVLGLIPVAGVFISLIPLCAIAFSIGGFVKVIYLLLMIIVLHAFEAYLLNPKLMSSKTKLPIFLTFAVLLVGEHFFGVWGLILGIPVFIFLLDLLEIKFLEKE